MAMIMRHLFVRNMHGLLLTADENYSTIRKSQEYAHGKSKFIIPESIENYDSGQIFLCDISLQ